MRAERGRIAMQYRAEGEEQALAIRANADREKEEILSAAYKEAETIRGEGDAEATRIYGEAYSKNPQFYKLTRTLESYKKILDDKTTIILSSDSDLLKILTKGQGASEMSILISPPVPAAIPAETPTPPRGRRYRHLLWYLVGAWLLSGIYIVQTDQQGLVTQWGKVVEPRVFPGIHYALPWPIDTRLQAQGARIAAQCRGWRDTRQRAWTNPNGQLRVLQRRSESAEYSGRRPVFRQQPEETFCSRRRIPIASSV